MTVAILRTEAGRDHHNPIVGGSPSKEALRLLASRAASRKADPDAQTLSAERRHA